MYCALSIRVSPLNSHGSYEYIVLILPKSETVRFCSSAALFNFDHLRSFPEFLNPINWLIRNDVFKAFQHTRRRRLNHPSTTEINKMWFCRVMALAITIWWRKCVGRVGGKNWSRMRQIPPFSTLRPPTPGFPRLWRRTSWIVHNFQHCSRVTAQLHVDRRAGDTGVSRGQTVDHQSRLAQPGSTSGSRTKTHSCLC